MKKRSRIYIESDNEIISIIKKAILKVGSEEIFLKKVFDLYNIEYKSKYIINHWFTLNWIPLEILKTASNILKLNYSTILNNKKIRGSCGYEIIFRKKINPQIANLFGWILSDGCISSGNQTIITQNNKEVLNNLKNVLISNFHFKEDSIKIRKINNNGFKSNKDCFNLCISSHAFKHILLNYYDFFSGKLKKTNIPKCILKGNKEIKKAFLTGFLEGDGNIYLIENKKARLMITCKTNTLSCQLKNLFENFYGKTKILYHKKKKCYTIQINSSEIITKIIIDLKKYFIHPEKIKNIEKIIKCDRFFKKLRIHLDNNYKKYLINKATTMIKTKGKMKKYEILSNLLSKSTNFDVKPSTIYCSWKYTWDSIPFTAFIDLCKIAEEDFKEFTPIWLMKFLKIRNILKNETSSINNWR